MQSNYYLPLRYAPLELEFTIVNDELVPIVEPQGGAVRETRTLKLTNRGITFQQLTLLHSGN